jgi:hypothetical protein
MISSTISMLTASTLRRASGDMFAKGVIRT